MKPMRKSYLVVAAWMIGLAMGSSAVLAQSDPGRIPGSALGSQGQVSDRDQSLIVAYTEYWIKQLQSGKPELISVARGRLSEPYNQGGTETFITFYDQTLAARIAAGMAAKDVAGRINTLIVARLIRHERVAEVIKAGLKDSSSAVSYQAAVAAEALTKNPKVGTAVKFGMRAPLMEALKKESSSFVLNYFYSALIAIDDSTGWDAVLTKMNERIAVHVAQSNAGIDAETEGLKALYNRLVLVKVGGDNAVIVNDKTLHQFILVCVRYMDYGLNKATEGEATTQLLDTCDFGSNWAADQLVKGGAKFTVPARIKDKPALEKKLMLSDWRRLLAAEPFKFEPAQIALPAAK